MHILQYPDFDESSPLLARPGGDMSAFREKVAPMLQAIKTEGDAAVRRFAQQFDRDTPEVWAVSDAEFKEAEASLPLALKQAIRQAYSNLCLFHSTQIEQPKPVETMPGVRCWRQSTPIERVGLYIPGGTAPLFSTALMLGVPAQLAGCREVVLCTPPQAGGAVHPAVLFAAQLCGIRKVFKLGGVQAIGAMAYGTATVPKVWKIFGPGNAWVTAAKQLVSLEGTPIDLPAGPSEVAVLADASANPAFVAADLLSQAEHGADSQVLLVTNSPTLLDGVQEALKIQLAALPRMDYATQALDNSRAFLVSDLEEGMRWINAYAPEHLILSVENTAILIPQVINAGSVFLGHYTPESAGDYASGTNHTLPTAGYARAYAGVSVDSFVKKVTFQEIQPEGLAMLGPTVVEMARAEGLEAHAQAVLVRTSANSGSLAQQNSSFIIHPLSLLREGIRTLKPYSSARDEFKTADGSLPPGYVFIDANENSLGSPTATDYSRYPDPLQRSVKKLLSPLKGVPENQIFLGNGSDEAIDLLFRAFCEPGLDNIILLPPTYGMYQVQADIHGTETRYAPLDADFQPNTEAVLSLVDSRSKLLFLCSPNNPTGNALPEAFVLDMLKQFPGMVVVDEAYADFSDKPSWSARLAEFPNLVVMQTLSKAWGLAALRLGMAFGAPEVIQVLNNIKYPYNVNAATMALVVDALQKPKVVDEKIATILSERVRLVKALAEVPCIERVFDSDANFLLVRTTDANSIYNILRENGVVVRNRHRDPGCANCLRITIGTAPENERLLGLLRSI
jgi:histidinol dehydrogenase